MSDGRQYQSNQNEFERNVGRAHLEAAQYWKQRAEWLEEDRDAFVHLFKVRHDRAEQAEAENARLREQYEGLRETRDAEMRATEQWQQRAARAEAENARLRNALQNVWGALQPCPEQGEIAMARSMVGNALATPADGRE